MGACIAPAYDNVFMGRLEETTLASDNIKLRFIDGIFMVINDTN